MYFQEVKQLPLWKWIFTSMEVKESGFYFHEVKTKQLPREVNSASMQEVIFSSAGVYTLEALFLHGSKAKLPSMEVLLKACFRGSFDTMMEALFTSFLGSTGYDSTHCW